jgi:hypothetical protein
MLSITRQIEEASIVQVRLLISTGRKPLIKMGIGFGVKSTWILTVENYKSQYPKSL